MGIIDEILKALGYLFRSLPIFGKYFGDDLWFFFILALVAIAIWVVVQQSSGNKNKY